MAGFAITHLCPPSVINLSVVMVRRKARNNAIWAAIPVPGRVVMATAMSRLAGVAMVNRPLSATELSAAMVS